MENDYGRFATAAGKIPIGKRKGERIVTGRNRSWSFPTSRDKSRWIIFARRWSGWSGNGGIESNTRETSRREGLFSLFRKISTVALDERIVSGCKGNRGCPSIELVEFASANCLPIPFIFRCNFIPRLQRAYVYPRYAQLSDKLLLYRKNSVKRDSKSSPIPEFYNCSAGRVERAENG